MAMNIKDPETERLAAEVAELAGESKTAAVREALRDRREKLAAARESLEERQARFHRFLEEEIWSQLPAEQLDQPPMSKEEVEDILGLGPQGW